MRSATGDATQAAGEHATKRDMRGCEEMRGGVRGPQHGREKREKRGGDVAKQSKLRGGWSVLEKLSMAAVVVLERDTHRGGEKALEAGRLVDFAWPVAASRASAEERREAWMVDGWGRRSCWRTMWGCTSFYLA